MQIYIFSAHFEQILLDFTYFHRFFQHIQVFVFHGSSISCLVILPATYVVQATTTQGLNMGPECLPTYLSISVDMAPLVTLDAFHILHSDTKWLIVHIHILGKVFPRCFPLPLKLELLFPFGFIFFLQSFGWFVHKVQSMFDFLISHCYPANKC